MINNYLFTLGIFKIFCVKYFKIIFFSKYINGEKEKSEGEEK